MGFEEVENYTHDSVRFSGVRFNLKKNSHYKNLKGVIGIGFNLINFKYEEQPSIIMFYENPMSLFTSKDVFYKPEKWREALKEFYDAHMPAIQSKISEY